MNVEIANRFAKRRREAGYSQEKLADMLGVSRQAVSKWERSESSPDTDNLIALAKLYDVSLDDLLYVDGSIAEDVEFEAEDRASSAQTLDDSSDDVQESSSDSTHPTKNKDYVSVSWREGVHVRDASSGDEVHVGWDGIYVTADSKQDYDYEFKMDKEGVEVGKNQFGSPKQAWLYYNEEKYSSAWYKFPFPILVVIVYLLLGFSGGLWHKAWLVFFAIPVYYLLVDAFVRKKAASALTALYSTGVTAWFLYMTIVVREPHPAWIAFLTIPIFGWLVHSLAHWWQGRRG